MKFLLFILIPLQVFAISPSDVCTNVASKSVGEALRCNEIISSEAHFDSSAVFGCHKMSHWTAKGSVDCLIAISNKVYPNQTAKTCNALASYSYKAIECFERSGKEYEREPSPCPYDTVLEGLHSSKSYILEKQYNLSYRKLTELENLILNCGRKK